MFGRMAVMVGWSPFLAATGGRGSTLWDVAIYGAVVLGALLLIVLVAQWYRSRMRKPDESGPAFTLQDLRDLRDRGELRPEEYERLRAVVVAEVRDQSESGSQS